MHYILCPRCNFKMNGSCRLCSTCGYKIPRVSIEDSTNIESKTDSTKKPFSLSRFFGIDRDDRKTGENGKEKPALS